MAKRQTRELSMRKVREILRLGLKCGKSNRDIERSCLISHVTAGRYIDLMKEKNLTYEEVAKMDNIELKRVLTKDDMSAVKTHHPQPDWGYIHAEMKKKGVTLQLLWQEYKTIYHDGYQYSQFCEHYSRWKKKLKISLRQTYKAGEKMFVDYAGQTVPIADRHTGKTTEAQIFVSTLGASNYSYVEATWDQSLPNWINSHIRGFEYFGGVTKMIVPDNLKSGVSKACKYEPDINPTYHEMAVHYGTVIMPARARKPKDKAKVESGVLVVERWILAALRNRTFFSLGEVNEAIRELLVILNNRPFKKLEGCRRSCFEKIEKEALLPLPGTPYKFAEWKKAKANIDYHIDVNGHYYSVPHSLRHKQFDVRYTSTTVEIFCDNKRVASHLRDDSKGRHTTVKGHMPESHQKYMEWTPSRIINWAGKIGESTAQLVTAILNTRKYPEQGYRSCLGILRLEKHYSEERLEAACRRALAIRGYSYKSVESILKTGLDKQQTSKPKTRIVVLLPTRVNWSRRTSTVAKTRCFFNS